MGFSLCSSGSTFILAYIGVCQRATLLIEFFGVCFFFSLRRLLMYINDIEYTIQNVKRIIGLFSKLLSAAEKYDIFHRQLVDALSLRLTSADFFFVVSVLFPSLVIRIYLFMCRRSLVVSVGRCVCGAHASNRFIERINCCQWLMKSQINRTH